MPKKKTKIELFEELAGIDENGCSRWVSVDEFVGKYQGLQLLNGAGWSRDDGTFGKKYIIERDKSITPGNKTDAIRTVGFNNGDYSQHIRADIKRQIQSQRCVILGTSNPEVDHKNGMKNEDRVMRNALLRTVLYLCLLIVISYSYHMFDYQQPQPLFLQHHFFQC